MARIARCDYVDPRDIDPNYPDDLFAIISRALQKAPEDRYPTAEAMLVDLRTFAEREALLASSIDVAALMREHFGNPAHPQTMSVSLPPPASPAPGPAAHRTRRGLPVPWVAVGVAAAFIGGLAFAAFAAFPGTEREQAPASSASPPDPPPTLEAPAPVGEPESRPPEAAPVEPAGTGGENPLVEETVVIEDPAEPADDESKPSRKRRGKSKGKRGDKKRTNLGPSPYPPGWDG